jgi:hypothetical protein
MLVICCCFKIICEAIFNGKVLFEIKKGGAFKTPPKSVWNISSFTFTSTIVARPACDGVIYMINVTLVQWLNYIITKSCDYITKIIIVLLTIMKWAVCWFVSLLNVFSNGCGV